MPHGQHVPMSWNIKNQLQCKYYVDTCRTKKFKKKRRFFNRQFKIAKKAELALFQRKKRNTFIAD